MNDLEVLHEELEQHKKSLKDMDENIKNIDSGNEKSIEMSKSEDSDQKIKTEVKNDNSDDRNNHRNQINSSSNKTSSSNRTIELTPSKDSSRSSYDKRSSRYESSRDQSYNRSNADFDLKRKYADEGSRYNQSGSRRPSERRNDTKSSSSYNKSRESEEDEPPNKKVTLQSAVVSSNMPIKTKDDLIKLQNKFNGSEQRNKRIFGVILGTLIQFKTDDKERSSTTQAIHRKELEKKIEIKKVEEMQKIAEEKKRLEEEKYRQLRIIRLVEQKIKLTEEFEFWKAHQLQLKNFIRTESKPFIYYVPKTLNDASKKLIEKTNATIDENIAKRQKETQLELDVLNKESDELNSAANSSTKDQKTKIENKENDAQKNKSNELLNTSMDSDELDEDKNNINVRIGDDEDEEEDVKNNSVKQLHDDAKVALEVISDESSSPDSVNVNDVLMADANADKVEENLCKSEKPSQNGDDNKTDCEKMDVHSTESTPTAQVKSSDCKEQQNAKANDENASLQFPSQHSLEVADTKSEANAPGSKSADTSVTDTIQTTPVNAEQMN